MKTKIQKFFCGSLVGIAVCAALTAITSCSETNDPTYLSMVRVSSSYVAIAQTGGSTSITVTANGDWAFAQQRWIDGKDTTFAAAPKWLNISPAQGTGGEATVTFSAETALDGRSCELFLECGGQAQRINVLQGLSTVSPATCAEVIAGPDSKTYMVTGVCTRIANTTYGNWYLEDATGEIYIYGTKDKAGNYNWPSFDIEVGDVVTVQGPKTTYNGIVELVDVSVISVKKSLVKIEEGETASLDAKGGDFLVRLSVNGDGPAVKVSDDATSWLGISSIVHTDSTVNISFHVAPNQEEAARMATIEFTSRSGSATSTVSATVSQMGLTGTLTNPFTVEQAIAYCQTLTGNSLDDFYIRGKISRIADKGSFGSYGNATFFISDDGEFLGDDDKNPDKAHDFEAYRALFLGNVKWADGNANISVGDEVIICGKVTLYNGISETASGNAYVYSINGVTTDENGVGSLVWPFNVAGAESCIDNGFKGNAFVKGIISRIVDKGLFGSYGNATFYISDDGEFLGTDDKTPTDHDFEAYRVLYLGNRNWEEGDQQIAVGDEVILHGELTKYGSTYETNSKKAYIYSLNGKTE